MPTLINDSGKKVHSQVESDSANKKEKNGVREHEEEHHQQRPYLSFHQRSPEYENRYHDHPCYEEVPLTDAELTNFLSDGFIELMPQIQTKFHQRLFEKTERYFQQNNMKNPGNNILPEIQDVEHIFDDPVVHGALVSILGPQYSMHPHRFLHRTIKGSQDQHWHKDSYYGHQQIRHHRPHLIFALYYPQKTTREMGPTILLKGTYCTETRLGEKEASKDGGFINPQMDEIPANWGDIQKRLTLVPAGTVILMHYNQWHRGSTNQSDKVRYLFKFIFARNENRNKLPSTTIQSVPRSPLLPKSIFLDKWKWFFQIQDVRRDNTELKRKQQKKLPSLIEQFFDPDIGDLALTECAYSMGQIGRPLVMELLIGSLYNPQLHISRNAMHGLIASGEYAVARLNDVLKFGNNNTNQNRCIEEEKRPLELPNGYIDRALIYACVALNEIGINVAGVIDKQEVEKKQVEANERIVSGDLAKEVIYNLIELGSYDPSNFVRREAIFAIGNLIISNPTTFPTLEDKSKRCGWNYDQVDEWKTRKEQDEWKTKKEQKQKIKKCKGIDAIVRSVINFLFTQLDIGDDEIRMAAAVSFLRLWVGMKGYTKLFLRSNTLEIEKRLHRIVNGDGNRYVLAHSYDLLSRMQSTHLTGSDHQREMWWRKMQVMRWCPISHPDSHF